MDVTVIVTTWGSDEWLKRGALTTTWTPGANHFHVDRPSSAGDARNRAVAHFDPKHHICFLDADDSLAPGYFQAMERAHEHDRQLLTPALRLGESNAACLDDRDIIDGWNPCPIGTLIHRTMFDAVGGFWDEPAWEDWSLFRRCVLLGATIRFVPKAVYHASFNSTGRNSTVLNPIKLRRSILQSHADWLAP